MTKKIRESIRNISFEDVVNMERGTIIADWTRRGIKCAIRKGGCSVCGYVGVPSNSPMAGKDYDSFGKQGIQLDVPWGLTYSEKGDGEYLAKGYWWYGWDYAHWNCLTDYDYRDGKRSGIAFTPLMIYPDVVDAANQLADMVKND